MPRCAHGLCPACLCADRSLVDHFPVEGHKVEGLAILTPVGLLRNLTVATKVAEVGLPSHDQYGSKQGQQELPLRFENGQSVEYLFCQVHCAVSPEGGYR